MSLASGHHRAARTTTFVLDLSSSRSTRSCRSEGLGVAIDSTASAPQSLPCRQNRKCVCSGIRGMLVRKGRFMSDHAQEEHLARIAGDIMFSETYMDLLESIYSERDTIVEFET